MGRDSMNNPNLQRGLSAEPSPGFPYLFLFGLGVSVALCLPQHRGSFCSIYSLLKQVLSSKSVIMSIKKPFPSSPQIKWDYHAS